ncbi:MAG: precorrin-6A reductase, partial [Clostridia bacterium]|nr:precorrin-6A reductase [Clostridia bacterium]
MIAVFSGTKDGRLLIDQMVDQGFNVMAFTATEYGEQLIEKRENLIVHWGKLNETQMKKLLINYPISCVVDATHPYAENASRTIIKSAQDCGINYFRYERKVYEDTSLIGFDNYDSIIHYLARTQGNILLTIGSNHIDIFFKKLSIERLYFRVLPTSNILKKCEDLGIRPMQLIAIQGPFTKAMNSAIYEAYDIQYVVTKNSG